MQWYLNQCHPISAEAQLAAQQRQAILTKPTGSLGDLESMAIELAAMQHSARPQLDQPWICIFAGDHGVMAEQISAYPQAVTRQMLQNFATGGAAISVMAKENHAQLSIIDCGTVGEAYDYVGVERHCVRAGTANFLEQAAMTEAECLTAMALGKDHVDLAKKQQASIFVAGEMGIGNTCSASALLCLLLDLPAVEMTGVGTGINNAQLQRKIAVVDRAITRYQAQVGEDAFKILCAVGGLEIAAMVGAYVRCAQLGLPILVDGFISSTAALIAVRLNPAVRAWMLFAHQSAEFGHRCVLQALDASPILQLNLRLGEGSGAGAALGILRLACRLHNDMATFAQADVDGDKVE